MDDLSSYVATHYLVADKKPKKRKRKVGSEASSGLIITDDDDISWGRKSNEVANESDKEEGPTVWGRPAEIRKKTTANWRVVGGITSVGVPGEAAAADAVIASAVAETEASRGADDPPPLIEQEKDVVVMSDGTHAGLQTSAAVSAQLEKRKQQEREDFERTSGASKETETVYRDATGRRIDISMRRAEARRAATEAEEKKRQAKEALRGDVQVEEAKVRREQIQDARLMPLARTADDEELNREQKSRQRWNDPMAQFVKTPATAQTKSKGRRPTYNGPTPPNRYGIRAGYRWDGVDRGNGFEARRFKTINRQGRNKDLDYAWQLDE